MFEISCLKNSEEDLWDRYVLNHPEGTFFHLTGWKRVVEKTFSHKSIYLLAKDKGKVLGVLPAFVVKSFLFGKSLVSTGFGAYGGVLSEDEKVAEHLIQKAIEITKEEKLDYFEVRNLYRKEPNLITKDLYYTFRKEIYEDPDDNLKSIPRKSRRMVRVGRDKYKLRCEKSGKDFLDPFYEVYAKSVHNLGSPVYPKSLFKNLLEEFKEDCKIFLITPNSSNEVLAGVMTFYYKDQVLPYYAGSTLKGKKMAANDFMYWNVMLDGCNRKYKLFDFGRSKKGTGSFSFKKHWGFEPKPLNYQYFLNKTDEVPNVSPLNPKYQRKIKLWKKLPFKLTKLIGPYLVKYIP